MYGMVDEIDGGKKVLFLTNAQADLLASSGESLDKMLQILEVPGFGSSSKPASRGSTRGPKLVINLIRSMGFENQLNDHVPVDDKDYKRQRPPFQTEQDEKQAEERIDCFMSETLIPLAERTNAVILTNAFDCNCILAQSLNRMVAVQKMKWSGSPPFTILAMTCQINMLYGNQEENSVWRSVKRQTRAWRMREKKIYQLLPAGGKTNWWYNSCISENRTEKNKHDLMDSSKIYIVVDSIDKKETHMADTKSFQHLQAELVRHFAATLPSLAIQTGWTGDTKFTAVDMVALKTPVVFLDVHRRPRLSCQTRAQLIDVAKTHQLEFEAVLAAREGMDQWMKPGYWKAKADRLNCATLAYFHDVLTSDGDPNTAESGIDPTGKNGRTLVALHEAIYWQTREENSNAAGGGQCSAGQLPPPTLDQVNSVAQFIAGIMPRCHIKNGSSGDDQSWHRGHIDRNQRAWRTLLMSPHFHHLNVHADLGEGEKLLRQLVKLDRLPKRNTIEGVHILRDAWCEYDIASHLALRYKHLAKTLFLLQLLVGIAIIVVGTADSVLLDTEQSRHIVFALSLVTTLLISLDALFNAKSRWRQLRSAAGSLESTIFLYRARVGPFGITEDAESREPDGQLCSALVKWRQELLASAGLQTSALKKDFQRQQPSIFKHHQFPPRAIMTKHRASAEEAGRKVGRLKAALDTELVGVHQLDDTSSPASIPRSATCRLLGPSVSNSPTTGVDLGYDRTVHVDDTSAHTKIDEAKATLKRAEKSFSDALEKCKDDQVKDDDFQSPIQPAGYIANRLQPTMDFYRRRIPQYAHRQYYMRSLLILCGIAASVLAYFGQARWAIVATAAAAGITSWTEFTDVARKTERYSRGVVEIENLLSFWKSLSEVDKASTVMISHLVGSGEAVISDERVGWLSTANKLLPTDNKKDAYNTSREQDDGLQKKGEEGA
jgi:hypothetical protein